VFRSPRLKAELVLAGVLTTVLGAGRASAQDGSPPPESVPTNAPQPGSDTATSPSEAAPSTVTPPASPEAPASSVAPSNDAPVEVKVKGARSEALRLQRSAEAVTVIETRTAKKETADLGTVLARSQGISVQRAGGLGTASRFSLAGLQEDQIRFFIDGVPLDRAGFPNGLVNIPVNLVERAEVYRGVVPIRFGADALGGAVNLVTDTSYRNHLQASYQVGSFGTFRGTLAGRYRHEPTGFVVGATAFGDTTRNDYPIDVEVADARGRVSPAKVRRFHDRYSAYGATLEAGFVERPWARRLILKGFVSSYDKELQHNVVMTTPYGEATYGETTLGLTARYEQPLSSKVELELLANYARRTTDFVDKSTWVYDWFGRRVRARRVPGEIDNRPTDQTIWQDGGFGRGTLKWALARDHVIRFSSSPSLTFRRGDERLQTDPNVPDPLESESKQFTLVSGVEYQVDLLDERLENIVFVKDYLYRATANELGTGSLRRRERDEHSVGAGDALRYRFTPWLLAKASYEYATRLPRPDEVFGNGILIQPNLNLEPEISHNGNVGPRIELRKTAIGDVVVDVNAFLRASDKLIVLLGTDRYLSYWNVYGARSVGLENLVSWTMPGRWLSLEGALTWQDVRNTSSDGTFGAFEGDRIPNRPWLFGSWGAHLRFPNVMDRGDTLEPFYYGRYVHSFYRGWESQGLREYKQVVDAQNTHDIGVSYSVVRDIARVTSTFEVDNVTNAKVYDFYGVQRPGRAFFMKITAEL
jgi:vitamin B12 transporter